MPRSLDISVRNETSDKKRRVKGEGTYRYNTKQGKWVYQVDLGTRLKGNKRDRLSASGKTKAEAKRKLDKKLKCRESNSAFIAHTAAIDFDKNYPRGEEHDVYATVLEYLEMYKRLSTSSRTYRGYLDIAKHFMHEFPGRSVESLSSTDFQEFLNRLAKKGKGECLIRQVKLQYKGMMKYAHEKGYIDYIPKDENFVAPKPRTGIMKTRNETGEVVQSKAIPPDILTKVIAAASTVDDKFFKTLVNVLLLTGMRIGEFLCLSKKDLDRKNNLVQIRYATTKIYEDDTKNRRIKSSTVISDTKTDAGKRTITVTAELFDVIDEWMEFSEGYQKRAAAKGNGDLLFPNRLGEMRTYDGTKRSFDRFLEKAGLKEYKITPHRFRHTFATLLFEAEVHPATVQTLLGHTDIKITIGTYTTVNTKELYPATDKLSAAIKAIKEDVLDSSKQK